MEVELPLAAVYPTSTHVRLIVSAAAVTILGAIALRLFLYPASRKPLGLPLESSNLRDESSFSAAKTSEGCRIKALYIYPIKSCSPVELDSAQLVKTGLRWDRQFTFAEKGNGEGGKWKFLTQRNYPGLARVKVDVFPGGNGKGGRLRVAFPTKGKFEVPLEGGEYKNMHLPLKPVRIWNDTPEAYDVSALVARELKQLEMFLGIKGQLGLFRICPENLREVYRCAPGKEQIGYQPVTGFADAYPLHIMNLSSVRDLNSRIPNLEVEVLRFRPNVILEGPPPFDEDDWKVITMGGALYHCACRTVRCRMPNVHPFTGERDKENPDRTMREYRCIDDGAKGMACLGMQVVGDNEEGMLRVGDAVRVKERGSHLYIRQ